MKSRSLKIALELTLESSRVSCYVDFTSHTRRKGTLTDNFPTSNTCDVNYTSFSLKSALHPILRHSYVKSTQIARRCASWAGFWSQHASWPWQRVSFQAFSWWVISVLKHQSTLQWEFMSVRVNSLDTEQILQLFEDGGNYLPAKVCAPRGEVGLRE